MPAIAKTCLQPPLFPPTCFPTNRGYRNPPRLPLGIGFFFVCINVTCGGPFSNWCWLPRDGVFLPPSIRIVPRSFDPHTSDFFLTSLHSYFIHSRPPPFSHISKLFFSFLALRAPSSSNDNVSIFNFFYPKWFPDHRPSRPFPRTLGVPFFRF